MKPPRKAAFLTLVGLAIVAIYSSCATVPSSHPLEANRTESLQGDNKAIILFGLEVDLDDKTEVPLDECMKRGFHLAIASIDKYEHPRTALPSSVDNSIDGKKWFYLTLAPGSYYFEVAKPDEGFWLQVPWGPRLVYAGTLHLSCFSMEEGFFRKKSLICAREVEIIDDSEGADKIALSFLSNNGPISSVLLKKYGKPAEPVTFTDLAPLGFTISCIREVGASTKLISSAISRWTTGETVKKAGSVAGYYVLGWAPFGAIGGAIAGTVDEIRFRPCLEQFEQEAREIDTGEIALPVIQKFGLSHTIRLTIGDDFSTAGFPSGLKSILNFDVIRIQFSNLGENSFEIEVTCRARLWDIARNRCLYDAIYTVGSPIQTYELTISNDLGVRDFGTYVRGDCRTILRDDILASIRLVVARLFKDLGLRRNGEGEEDTSQVPISAE